MRGQTQQSKADKHLCQINATQELRDAIAEKKKETGLIKEEMIRDALKQLLQPYSYQLGLGHESFSFLAVYAKSPKTKVLSFWIPIPLWKRIKETMMSHNVKQNTVLHTAIYNYFLLPKIQKNEVGHG